MQSKEFHRIHEPLFRAWGGYWLTTRRSETCLRRIRQALLLTIWFVAVQGHCQEEFAVRLPDGVRAEWGTDRSQRITTPAREQICVNGLWRWQPAQPHSGAAPSNHWGYFKVPGPWPGITDYMQKDSQTVFAHPSWKDERLGNLSAAWYEREISIPRTWSGRRIEITVEYLNSFAAIFVDGIQRGELRFPGGAVDLTDHVRPGRTHLLSLHVTAMPLKGVLLSYSDSNAAREVAGKVARRGLCGDVFLVSQPSGARIGHVTVDTSVRNEEITIQAQLDGLRAGERYQLRAQISQEGRVVKEFASGSLAGSELEGGRIRVSERWKAETLWDLHTPHHQFELILGLHDGAGRALDTAFPIRFGYREFWIDGRDFFLNGTRIWLCAVPLDNAQIGAAMANYDRARESLERLKGIGINFVYTHNYGCEPGSHLSFTEILRAADDAGMLVSLSQPHFSHYDWKSAGADRTNGYADHAESYVRVAGNHPSVVAYAMSHNATGYSEDMNPDLIDGRHDPRDSWSQNNARLALRAEAIVKRLDPRRIVYHHASGNLGSMHTSNFYPNFAPIQELSDWFEHWATHGVKPLFTCEYAAPFSWDWTMYRGWYKGQREFGSANVPWEFCLAEWNAQFLGDRAFQISQSEAENLRWEARQFAAGKVWHRWDYPHAVGSPVFDERFPVFARYLADNWPAFRSWGVSAISPWEYGHFWKLRPDIDRGRQQFDVDWPNLQRPGFSPDYVHQQYERMDLAFRPADWIPTAAAQALLRYNRPLLAFLGGKPAGVTSKDHIFLPGETVEKQLVIINNSRQTVSCKCEWSFGLPKPESGQSEFSLPTGEQKRLPLRFTISQALSPGQYPLRARVTFNGDELQADTFPVHVLPPSPAVVNHARIALFDPQRETAQLLDRHAIRWQSVDVDTDLSPFEILIVGKAALTTGGPAPDIERVRNGLKVLVFEQTPEALESRLGFRVAAYGLRQAYARVPDHPILAGLTAEHLRDWRGEATILPPRLSYELRPRYGPTVDWCGLPVPRLWRCGNRGNVASALIEKPARGDFLPLIDGGYGLQYSPLLECHDGRGLILFCQMDVTGRTESDPAAEMLVKNMLRYLANWKPASARKTVYAGEPAGRRHLVLSGIPVDSFNADSFSGTSATDHVLVLGPDSGREIAAHKAVVADWLEAGGRVLALGLNQRDTDAVLPLNVVFKTAEHISAFFEPQPPPSAFAGLGPADLHNRDPREFPLIASGAVVIGDGILASVPEGNIVFCQIVPWHFDSAKAPNQKRTFRRASIAVARLLANLGAALPSPIPERFKIPVASDGSEKRWLVGLYVDQPEEWDDPYRFFRW